MKGNEAGTKPALTVRDYSVSFGSDRGPLAILRDINLTIAPGEVLGLVGESGSGKSTLAYAVMRALRAQITDETGTIDLAGTELTGLNQDRLSRVRGNRVAMVFQDPGASLNPTSTLGEHFRQVLTRHRGLSAAAVVVETVRLLDRVGLADPDLMRRKYPHEVSGGEKQRAVIALAFACDPDLILFDEPTSALDATTAVSLLDLFATLQRDTGVAALFISHDLGVVSEIAHRVAVIYAGRIVEVATNRDLFTSPCHPYTRALLNALPRPALSAAHSELATIEGSLPDRAALPDGCPFAPRCSLADDQCRALPVKLGPIQLGPAKLDAGVEAGLPHAHAVACLHWQRHGTSPSKAPDSIHGTSPRDGSEASEARLQVRDLSVRISRPDLFARLLGRPPTAVHAVNAVRFSIAAGETLGLVGESGCGKSSLARALCGLRTFEGQIEIGGRSFTTPAQMDREFRRQVQIIFQNPDLSLNPRQTIGTILSRPLHLYSKGDSQTSWARRVAALLERVNLPAEMARRYPHELSGGEKQRVAIARALGASPTVIICDEITSGLDASVQAAVVNLLQSIQAASGVSFLFITHDLNLLRHVADRVAVMYLGEIVEVRDAATIGRPPYHPYTEALLGSAPSLEPDVEVRRMRLEGSIPGRTSRLRGCAFESRCPRRVGDICREQRPPVRTFNEDQAVTCHLSNEELLMIEPIWRRVDGAPRSARGPSPHAK